MPTGKMPKPTNDEQAFAVVFFIDEDWTYCKVPRTWLVYDKDVDAYTKCWWPSACDDTMLGKFVDTAAEPDKESWKVLIVRVVKDHLTRKEANMKVARMAKHDGKMSTGDDSETRRIVTRVFDGSVDDDTSDDEITWSPKRTHAQQHVAGTSRKRAQSPNHDLPTKVGRLSVQKDDDSSGPGSSKSPAPQQLGTEQQPHVCCQGGLNVQSLKQLLQEVVEDKVTHMFEEIQNQLDELSKAIVSIEKKQDAHITVCNATASTLEKTAAPAGVTGEQAPKVSVFAGKAQTAKDMATLDAELESNQATRDMMRRRLTPLAGSTEKGTVKAILRSLMAHDVLMMYSLRGRGDRKLPFDKTALYRMVVEICHRVHPTVEMRFVDMAIGSALCQEGPRHSKQAKRLSEKLAAEAAHPRAPFFDVEDGNGGAASRDERQNGESAEATNN